MVEEHKYFNYHNQTNEEILYKKYLIFIEESYNGNIKKLEEIMSELDFIPNVVVQRAFRLAFLQNHVEVVKILLDKTDIGIDKIEGSNFTPFMLAVQFLREEMVDVFLEREVKINAVDQFGCTAIEAASNIVVTKTLLDLKENGLKSSFMGRLQLHLYHYLAASASDIDPKSLSIVKKLLKAGSGIHSVNDALLLTVKGSLLEDELKLYKQNPIEYILKNNDNAKHALNAIKNLKEDKPAILWSCLIRPSKLSNCGEKLYNDFYHPQDYTKIEKCLQEQSQLEKLDLNSICGEASSHYNDYVYKDL